MDDFVIFYVIHLFDADDNREASEEVWFREGDAHSPEIAAKEAVGMFGAEPHHCDEETLAEGYMKVAGPFTFAPVTVKVEEDENEPEGWAARVEPGQ